MRHITGLRIDVGSGEGEVSLPAEFLGRNGLFKADVIGDWIGDLTALYEESIGQMHAEWAGDTVELAKP